MDLLITFLQNTPSPAISSFGMTNAIALPTAKRKKENKVCWCQPMPGCMSQRSINVAPTSRIIDQYHQANSGTPENIERIKPLVQNSKFWENEDS